MTFQRSRFVLPRYVNAAVSLRRRAHPGLPDTVDVAMVEIENRVVGRAGWRHVTPYKNVNTIVEARRMDNRISFPA